MCEMGENALYVAEMSRPAQIAWGVLLAGVAACTTACGDVRYVDPVVNYGDEDPYQPTGTPELDLGFYVDQLYGAIEDGSDVRIIFGRQGGTWIMPAVRARGVAVNVTVNASLVTASGEELGQVSTAQQLSLATDGWLELQILPIPARHAPPNEADPIDDLYGQEAHLSVNVIDDGGRTAERELTVILAQE